MTGRSRPVSPTAGDVLRRLRFPLALAALILLAGAAVGLLQPRTGRGYLDPDNPGPSGSRALVQILVQRGEHVTRASTPQQAERAAVADVTLVITSPAYLDRGDLAALGQLPGDRFLVAPGASALRALAPGISASGAADVAAHAPACRLAAARLAGDADTGGVLLRVTLPAAWPPADTCYRAPAMPSLVRYESAGRTITVLGTGAPLTNQELAGRGNAALAINLLASQPTVVWLTPGISAAGGHQTLTSLIPWAAYLVAIQLAVAVVTAAAWRARRLGPLVTEPLPVVVRAAETVEGHGRLYRSRHARDRATDALRGAVIERLLSRLGLPAGTDPATITAAVAVHSGRDAAAVGAALFGPAPDTDAALVQLASNLDSLESEMRKT